eukprot:5297174-Pyramimonas_sp.AAC.1
MCQGPLGDETTWQYIIEENSETTEDDDDPQGKGVQVTDSADVEEEPSYVKGKGKCIDQDATVERRRAAAAVYLREKQIPGCPIAVKVSDKHYLYFDIDGNQLKQEQALRKHGRMACLVDYQLGQIAP